MSKSNALASLLSAVIAYAEAAGRMLTDEFYRPAGPRGGGGHSPVDAEIEAMLRGPLLALQPGQWRGEEGGALDGEGPFCWLVDPHDGTSAFLAGERGSAVSIGLLRDGVPVLGVVHAPLSPDRGADTIAWAEGMGQVLRNGVPVAARLEAGALTPGSIVLLQYGAADWPLSHGRAVHPARFVALPSIAYRLARVAAGDAVAAVSLATLSGWGCAAGHALLRGAGGILLDETGAEVTYGPKGESGLHHCHGGAPAAARELARRDWSPLRSAGRLARRTPLDWPRRADGPPLDRSLGCLFGLVAGDSLGALVEFRSPLQIARSYPHGLRDLADGGTWNIIAGQPTDDGELALELARTLVGPGGWSAERVAHAYAGWFSSLPFDIGSTTAQALLAASAADRDRAGAARRAANRSSQANGALMRCAPIGIWARDAAEAAAMAREDAGLTHPHPICQAASAAFVAAIATAIAGGDAPAMRAAALAATPEPAAAPLHVCLAAAARREGPPDFLRQQGWVLIAFHNAFHHLAMGTPLEEAIIRTVAEGGDTDTNAAICGALLGAAQGHGAMPSRWSMAIQACRPMEELGALQPRPARYWADDLPALAEALLARRLAR